MSLSSTGRLAGKTALITGGSRGIGLALARALAAEGAAVIITGRNKKALDEAEAEVRKLGECHGIACDVRDERSVEQLFAQLRARDKQLDILVNNAGTAGPSAKIDELPVAAWREMVETNLTGVFLVTRAALQFMKPGATIVNNVSVAARTVFPGMAGYNASKAGALGFTDALREELRPRGIRVIALMPGAVDTGIWEQFWPGAPREKMMRTESIAEAVLCALLMPEGTSMQEIVMMPTAGKL